MTSDSYYCYFLAKYLLDTGKSDDSSSWWPDWYCYSRDSISKDIIFGDRILFGPNISPDGSKYIQWEKRANLLDEKYLILGSFNFEILSPTNRTPQKVATDIWLQLANICLQCNILQPTVGIHLNFNHDYPTMTKSSKKWRRNIL